MDKASDFESEDCEFESRRGRRVLSALNMQDAGRHHDHEGTAEWYWWFCQKICYSWLSIAHIQLIIKTMLMHY